jgi:hypothetical protein
LGPQRNDSSHKSLSLVGKEVDDSQQERAK